MTQATSQFRLSDGFRRLLRKRLSRRWASGRNRSDFFFLSLKYHQHFLFCEKTCYLIASPEKRIALISYVIGFIEVGGSFVISVALFGRRCLST